MTKSTLMGTLILILPLVSIATPIPAEDEGRLVLNEVMYDPIGDELNGEWIELLVVDGDMNSGGWTLTDLDGHEFVLPPLVLPIQTYLVVRVGPGVPEEDVSDGEITLYMNSSQPILKTNSQIVQSLLT